MVWPAHPNPGAFGGLEEMPERASSRYAVLPVPFDGTSTWQKGADRGPEAILAASANMELYDIETRSEPWRSGIFTLAPVTALESVDNMVDQVREITGGILDEGLTPVGIGGEHSVSIGMIQACARRHEGLAVLQLDAHADTRETYEGSAHNHACVMARAREVAPIVQVGIRSLDAAEMETLDTGRVIFAHEFDAQVSAWKVTKLLKAVPVYITVDLDCLDPAEMPSTGTPEPGGLRYRELIGLLGAVMKKRRVVGFDVVELMPREHDRAPDFLAARLIYQMMAYHNQATERGF